MSVMMVMIMIMIMVMMLRDFRHWRNIAIPPPENNPFGFVSNYKVARRLVRQLSDVTPRPFPHPISSGHFIGNSYQIIIVTGSV